MVVLTSFTQPTVGVRHRQQNTSVYVNNNNLGKGTLYIAESLLSWIGETGNGFSIEYPHIALHAISRDLSAFPQECLFLMLDTPLADDDQNHEEDEDVEGDDSNKQETTEMRLVPDDRGMLDAMFHAMNECQALHPDPEDSFSDEDFFEDADDESPMEEADSQMSRLRIGNMDGRSDMEDMVEGRVGGMRECRVWGMGEEQVEDLRESMALDMEEDMEEDVVEGILGGRVEDRVEGMDSTLYTSGGREGGMVEERVEGTDSTLYTSGEREEVEGTDSTLHTSGEREEVKGTDSTLRTSGEREEVEGTDSTLRTSGEREGGMEAGMVEERVEGTDSTLYTSGEREGVEGMDSTLHTSGGREGE